ncbi:MAG: Dabb family protein [Brevinematales bacterium]|nr:Dabb family protein [Brevinematales bacterium]
MIKHIVMWKLKDKEKALIIKDKLESLNGKIPGLIKLEIGLDFSKTQESADIVLYSEFESREALLNYQSHPEHKAIIPLVSEAKEERRMVDYEI